MDRSRGNRRQITAAKRGNIVQRVLVDGWTTAEAAARFDISEQRVVIWVAAYRRHGMASLRDAAVAGDRAPHPWLWLWLWPMLATRLAVAVRRGAKAVRAPGKPDRRSRWNG